MLTSVMHLHWLVPATDTTDTTEVPMLTSEAPAEGETHTEVAAEQPSPLEINTNELIWAGGSFLVFAVVLRYVLYPRLRKSMDARYNSIRGAHEQAEGTRQAARTEVADYEAQLAGVKAEAAARVDAARQTLENERQQKVAALTATLDGRRAEARAAADAAREAVRPQIQAAVAEVAGKAGELATGSRPNSDMVNRVVNEVMAR